MPKMPEIETMKDALEIREFFEGHKDFPVDEDDTGYDYSDYSDYSRCLDCSNYAKCYNCDSYPSYYKMALKEFKEAIEEVKRQNKRASRRVNKRNKRKRLVRIGCCKKPYKIDKNFHMERVFEKTEKSKKIKRFEKKEELHWKKTDIIADIAKEAESSADASETIIEKIEKMKNMTVRDLIDLAEKEHESSWVRKEIFEILFELAL